MNPGAVEEGAKVATGIVDALKAQPAMLALILVNFGMLLFIFYGLHSAATFREKMFGQVLDNTARIHAVMQSRAVACPPTTDPTP
jgi:hypothetical protein